MALFLVIAIFVFEIKILGVGAGDRGVLGGPGVFQGDTYEEAQGLMPILIAEATTQTGVLGGEAQVVIGEHEPFVATLYDYNRPAGIFSPNASIVTYTVEKGDTLSRIAERFGISSQTITAANPKVRERSLRVGQELVVLPVSGIVYEAQGGETVEDIALQFGIALTKIKETNPALGNGPYKLGTPIIVPGGVMRRVASSNKTLPNLDSYFIMPTTGYNWGQLHANNAVDIANARGTIILASAEGLVVEARDDGWNQGYGHYILIEHPNGTKTRYAHLDELRVGVGSYVKQKEEIATIGNTGNVHGPTGYHLHFEIEGAHNPFAK